MTADDMQYKICKQHFLSIEKNQETIAEESRKDRAEIKTAVLSIHKFIYEGNGTEAATVRLAKLEEFKEKTDDERTWIKRAIITGFVIETAAIIIGGLAIYFITT